MIVNELNIVSFEKKSGRNVLRTNYFIIELNKETQLLGVRWSTSPQFEVKHFKVTTGVGDPIVVIDELQKVNRRLQIMIIVAGESIIVGLHLW